ATVQEKVIYQFSLFAASSQEETILPTILENFTVIDPAAARQQIFITAPVAGARLTDPFELRGATGQYPFRGRLVYRVLDAEGNQVGRGPFEVVGRLGSPSNFALAASYKVATDRPGTVEVAEMSAADGTLIAIDSVAVQLAADPGGYSIVLDDPKPYASVTSPVQIRGKAERKPAGGALNYRLVDANGQQLSSGFLQTSGPIGEENLFDGFAEFSVTADGPGRVEVYDVFEDGSIVSIGTVNVWLTATP
ncbi:MAG: Gmad2 immunoglobulin-like domain-containing protein, partial [Chloroflexota bacterium]